MCNYNILLIDDQPYSLEENVKVLIEKFCEKFCHSTSCSDASHQLGFFFNALKKFKHDKVLGKSKTLKWKNEVSLTIYVYDCNKTKAANQTKIINLIQINKTNILWTDRGQSLFKVQDNRLFGTGNGYSANADALFENDKLTKALEENGFHQVAIATYNPALRNAEIENAKNIIIKKLGEKNKDKIRLIETSPVLLSYDKIHNLTASTITGEAYLGRLETSKIYGNFLGHIFFDLFLKLDHLSEEEDRYNFFKEGNFDFLRYLKLINENIKNTDNYRLGMVAYSTRDNETPKYLIDSPYKPYYKVFDKHLADNKINDLFVVDNSPFNFIYFRYAFERKTKPEFYYYSNTNLRKKGAVSKFLPYLHSAVFYDPGFYTGIDIREFKLIKRKKESNDFVEVFYFIKKDKFHGVDGELNFAIYRLSSHTIYDHSHIEEFAQIYFDKFFRLIEPKVEANIIPHMFEKVKAHALQSAIAKIFARNYAHNIGSHVAIRAKNSNIKARIKEIYGDAMDLNS